MDQGRAQFPELTRTLGKGRIESSGDFGKEFGRQMQVVLSSGKMLVPQVGGQERKFGVEVLTVPIPASQGMDGEEVPKIVDPGPLPDRCSHRRAFPKQTDSSAVVDSI